MDPLSLTIADQVVTITLNRPEQRNAVTYEMWTQLAEVCSRLDDDEQVRVVIVQGAGDEAFSAGGDISEFEQRRSDPWQAKIYNGKMELAIRSLARLRKPTIALIKGYCIGGGLVIASHCDLRFAADNAIFGLPVGKLGALVNYYEIERLIHLIGVGATLDLLLTARFIDANEAQKMALCNRIFPLPDVDRMVQELAAQMCEVAPLTQQWHKQMVRTVLRKPDLVDLDPEEAALPEICFDTEDYAEGVQAFLQKRKPIFRGR